ncbi:MAG: alpha/beta hydrolase [Sphingobium sp.]
MHNRENRSRALISVVTALVMAASPLAAQPAAVPPAPSAFADIPAAPEPGAIALRPPVRGALPAQWEARGPSGRAIRNVVNPTLTPFLPDPAKANGTAVIVAPGGGFRMLSIDAEGYDVARRLAAEGVAAFVLEYRTVPVPRDRAGYYKAFAQMMASATSPTLKIDVTAEALEDAQAAMRLVRSRAAEWHVDPARVGFIGFSAGAMTTLAIGLAPDKAVRPDFIAPIYGPMEARAVPADAPPMFNAIALDDPIFAARKPMGIIQSWRDAGRPVEVHLYERGGHGFGMGARTAAAALWMDEFIAWMKDRRLVGPAAARP